MSAFFTIFLLITCLSTSLYGNLDLNTMILQGLVEETKQIHIPGYATAFNPTIIEWNDAYLFCFRIRNPKTQATNEVGFVWLDKEFNVISSPKKLRNSLKKSHLLSMTQDPRLIKCREELYFVCNDMVSLPSGGSIRRMVIAKLSINKNSFSLKDEQVLLTFEGEKNCRNEKNWVPFEYEGNLLLSATINPHLVFMPIEKTSSCMTYSASSVHQIWHWGELRGGTTAILDNGEYLAFFHCAKDLTTVQSKGKRIVHYFMGAYKFSASPPFNLTKISQWPIIGSDFYNPPEYPTWKPLLVVFPCGMIIDEKYIYVVYGRQDFECWVAKINKQVLLETMKKVE